MILDASLILSLTISWPLQSHKTKQLAVSVLQGREMKRGLAGTKDLKWEQKQHFISSLCLLPATLTSCVTTDKLLKLSDSLASHLVR